MRTGRASAKHFLSEILSEREDAVEVGVPSRTRDALTKPSRDAPTKPFFCNNSAL